MAATMRVCLILLTISPSLANHLISFDKVEDLFKKYTQRELSNSEKNLFGDVLEILHIPHYASTQESLNSGKTRTTLTCVLCRSFVAAAIESVVAGQSNEEISQTLTTLCILANVFSSSVCTGVIKLNLPILRYIIETKPEATENVFCGLVLQQAENPDACPFTDSRFDWQVDLPAPPAVAPVPIVDTKPLKAVILTDFHIDPLYEPYYGVSNCDEPTCCRRGQRPEQRLYSLDNEDAIAARSVVNDSGVISLNLAEALKLRNMRSFARARRFRLNPSHAGFWGDYGNCDTPVWAFDDAIDRIVEDHKDIDVVYYIGDTIDHFIWSTTYEMINEVSLYAIDKLRTTFGDDVLVIPVIGNHESQPTNQFAPSYITGEGLNTTWLYEALAIKWNFYLPDDAKATFKETGQYSILVRPGLRVITLNNNVAYRYNWWVAYDPLNAKKHLDWLVEELTKAEVAGENVHILAHIPPGVPDLYQTWTKEYNRVVNRFSTIIKGQFNGHTHSDEFKLFYNDEGQPINVAWGVGGLTAHTHYNLNYKIATFHGATYEPENIYNFVYNLTEANLTPNRRPYWFQIYDMKNTFRLADLSANSIHNLVERMVTTDRNLLVMYAAFFSKLSDSRMPQCDHSCQLDIVCNTVVSVLWERERCEELRNKLYSNNV